MAPAGHNRCPWTAALLIGLLTALVFGLCCPFSGPALAGLRALERDVKAAYLYNFLFFVRWPKAQDAEYWTICVLGPDPFGPSFHALDGRRLPNGKRLRIRYLSSTPLGSHSGCRVVFFSRALSHEAVAQAMAMLRGKAVLTVSDRPGFLKEGGMIALVTVKDRVRWVINKKSAEQAGLKFSSQLLRNALFVEE